MMEPGTLIRQDHRAVKALFRKFERAKGDSEKQKLAQQIIEELSVHAAVEEQLLYPVLREAKNTLEKRVLNALEEHHAAKLVLAELDGMQVGDERFDAKMHVVREAVESHIEEEEAFLLPALPKMLDRGQRMRLSEAMVQLKQSAPNHPHPSAPDTPPAGMVASLIAKVTDVGKDLIRKVTAEDKAEGHQRVRRRAAATARKVSVRKSSPRRSTTAARPRKRATSSRRRRKR
jgi:hemerythrin-like domain-containing protein